MPAGSAVPGDLRFRRFARDADRDGGFLRQQTHRVPGGERQEFGLAQPHARLSGRVSECGWAGCSESWVA